MTCRRVPAGSRALLATLLVGAFALVACAAGPNTLAAAPAAAGFWLGLWHGVISPITFLVSLFTPTVNIYEIHNSGHWYDFGFMLGVSFIFGGPLSTHHAVRTRRAAR
jgi:uncharacterized membrane protein HdeD (DUF308 family)